MRKPCPPNRWKPKNLNRVGINFHKAFCPLFKIAKTGMSYEEDPF